MPDVSKIKSQIKRGMILNGPRPLDQWDAECVPRCYIFVFGHNNNEIEHGEGWAELCWAEPHAHRNVWQYHLLF